MSHHHEGCCKHEGQPRHEGCCKGEKSEHEHCGHGHQHEHGQCCGGRHGRGGVVGNVSLVTVNCVW